MVETSIPHYRIASYIPSDSRVHFTTLSHFYYHLHRFHLFRTSISALVPHIKPCAYRVTCFYDGHQSCHYFTHYDNLILNSFISQKNLCYRQFSVPQGHVKSHTFIREGNVRVGTNNTENPQRNTLHRNKLLSLSKVHNNSSSTSLCCDSSSFNFMYKLLTLSFDCNISEDRVIGMDNKVDICNNNVVSTLQFSPQFIQTQLTRKDIPYISTHTQPTKYIPIPLNQPTKHISIPLKQSPQSMKTPLKQPS